LSGIHRQSSTDNPARGWYDGHSKCAARFVMPYLIDGHNLIGQLPDISLDDPNDEAQLVQKLAGFVARTRHRCVVVFDHGLPGGSSRMSTRGVQVIFASQHSNADRVLIDRIHKERNPRGWTVVSSDNTVLATARRSRMQTRTSAEFAAMLQRPLPPLRPGPDEAPDVQLSPEEVDEWLDLFGRGEG
jgi:uncharacterized protein